MVKAFRGVVGRDEASSFAIVRPRLIRMVHVRGVLLRHWRLQDAAIELVVAPEGGPRTKSYFMAFPEGEKARDFAALQMRKMLPRGAAFQLPRGSHGQLVQALVDGPESDLPDPTAAASALDSKGKGTHHVGSWYFRRSRATHFWQSRDMTNLEYLHSLNRFASRTRQDLSAYAVAPWVVASVGAAALDFSNPATFRDLRRPIGALRRSRLLRFRDAFKELESVAEMTGLPPRLYGSHFSTEIGVVVHFLLRMHPFATLHANVQSGAFDVTDRLFDSVAGAWRASSRSPNEVKEITPEWYESFEFTLNRARHDFGKRMTGRQVGDVRLPPWCDPVLGPMLLADSNRIYGCAMDLTQAAAAAASVASLAQRAVSISTAHVGLGPVHRHSLFTRLQRQALESLSVSSRMHHWIDLMFGHKQRGKAALAHDNVFERFTYAGAIDWNTFRSDDDKRAASQQVAHYGQSPLPLLRSAHPVRGAPPTAISKPRPLGEDLRWFAEMRREATGRAFWGTVEGGVPLLPWGLLPAVLPGESLGRVEGGAASQPSSPSKAGGAGTDMEQDASDTASVSFDSSMGLVSALPEGCGRASSVRGLRVVMCHSFDKLVVCSQAGFSVWRARPAHSDASSTSLQLSASRGGPAGGRFPSGSPLVDYAEGAPAVFLRVGDVVTHGGSPPPCAAVLLVEPSELLDPVERGAYGLDDVAAAIQGLVLDRRASSSRTGELRTAPGGSDEPIDKPPLAWPTGMTCRLHYVEDEQPAGSDDDSEGEQDVVDEEIEARAILLATAVQPHKDTGRRHDRHKSPAIPERDDIDEDKVRRQKLLCFWQPVAPEGYCAMGCVVGDDPLHPPPLKSVVCVRSDLVSMAPLREPVPLASTVDVGESPEDATSEQHDEYRHDCIGQGTDAAVFAPPLNAIWPVRSGTCCAVIPADSEVRRCYRRSLWWSPHPDERSAEAYEDKEEANRTHLLDAWSEDPSSPAAVPACPMECDQRTFASFLAARRQAHAFGPALLRAHEGARASFRYQCSGQEAAWAADAVAELAVGRVQAGTEGGADGAGAGLASEELARAVLGCVGGGDGAMEGGSAAVSRATRTSGSGSGAGAGEDEDPSPGRLLAACAPLAMTRAAQRAEGAALVAGPGGAGGSSPWGSTSTPCSIDGNCASIAVRGAGSVMLVSEEGQVDFVRVGTAKMTRMLGADELPSVPTTGSRPGGSIGRAEHGAVQLIGDPVAKTWRSALARHGRPGARDVPPRGPSPDGSHASSESGIGSAPGHPDDADVDDEMVMAPPALHPCFAVAGPADPPPLTLTARRELRTGSLDVECGDHPALEAARDEKEDALAGSEP